MRLIIGVLATLAFAGWVDSASAVPITSADIVAVDGTQWAQVDLFTNLSWNDIDAVCPGGTCISGGELNGFTMTGWTWAGWDAVGSLFNSYLIAAGVLGDDLLGPGGDPNFGDSYLEGSSAWAEDFFSSGWRPTQPSANSYQYALGFTTQLNLSGDITIAQMAWSPSGTIADETLIVPPVFQDRDDVYRGWGGWFYRLPASSVPVPATLGLYVLALAGLGWTRRKTKMGKIYLSVACIRRHIEQRSSEK